MTTDSQLAERLTAEHASCLASTSDGLVEGILEGAREGLAEGLEKGGREALIECLFRGPDNIGAADAREIIEAIPQAIIKASVIKGAKPILKQTTELYLKQACQKLIAELRETDIKPSPGETDLILELIQRSQQEAVERIAESLPKNPLFGAIADGMQSALKDSLKKSLTDCRAKIRQELGQNEASGHGQE